MSWLSSQIQLRKVQQRVDSGRCDLQITCQSQEDPQRSAQAKNEFDETSHAVSRNPSAVTPATPVANIARSAITKSGVPTPVSIGTRRAAIAKLSASAPQTTSSNLPGGKGRRKIAARPRDSRYVYLA